MPRQRPRAGETNSHVATNTGPLPGSCVPTQGFGAVTSNASTNMSTMRTKQTAESANDADADKENFQPTIAERTKQRTRKSSTKMHDLPSKEQQQQSVSGPELRTPMMLSSYQTTSRKRELPVETATLPSPKRPRCFSDVQSASPRYAPYQDERSVAKLLLAESLELGMSRGIGHNNPPINGTDFTSVAPETTSPAAPFARLSPTRPRCLSDIQPPMQSQFPNASQLSRKEERWPERLQRSVPHSHSLISTDGSSDLPLTLPIGPFMATNTSPGNKPLKDFQPLRSVLHHGAEDSALPDTIDQPPPESSANPLNQHYEGPPATQLNLLFQSFEPVSDGGLNQLADVSNPGLDIDRSFAEPSPTYTRPSQCEGEPTGNIIEPNTIGRKTTSLGVQQSSSGSESTGNLSSIQSTSPESVDTVDTVHTSPTVQHTSSSADPDFAMRSSTPGSHKTSAEDQEFVEEVKKVLKRRGNKKTRDVARRQARRICQLLELAKPPDTSEALFLSGEEAAKYFEPNVFFPGIIVTSNQQPLPLQTTTQFLAEYYDDSTKVWIQDPSILTKRDISHAREITIAQLKHQFAKPAKDVKVPWNCLELATHVEDGLRPAYLSNEDCRLLTKLKHPSSGDSTSRRGYEPGWKEVEKWALLAQGGALTEPHQDSHGYNTYITMNQGIIGFGWLANPSTQEREEWFAHSTTFTGGHWRYVVLRPGQTVYFPSGTVHFVFRLPAVGDTLAFGGHLLRCSQIVGWVRTMLEELAGPEITNEDLSVSALGYLERVERFVRQALVTGETGRWGGEEGINEFLKLKEEFLKKGQ